MTEAHSKQHHRSVRPNAAGILRSLIGAFLGIASIAAIDQFFMNDSDLMLMIGAFGATAVLVYGAPYSPLAQPYNVIVGHIISAFIGVTVFLVVGEANWLSTGLAVSLAITAMQLTRSVHPPGGATALIAVVASPVIHELGYMYVLFPVATGAVILVCIAYVSNNFRNQRPWPIFWY